jgi:hypothetical protein
MDKIDAVYAPTTLVQRIADGKFDALVANKGLEALKDYARATSAISKDYAKSIVAKRAAHRKRLCLSCQIDLMARKLKHLEQLKQAKE